MLQARKVNVVIMFHYMHQDWNTTALAQLEWELEPKGI